MCCEGGMSCRERRGEGRVGAGRVGEKGMRGEEGREGKGGKGG